MRLPRRTIFLGCEGESERSYGAFLQALANDRGLPVSIAAYIAAPAGDSLAIAGKVVAQAKRSKVAYAGKFCLLDADMAETQPAKAREAQNLLEKSGFVTIWQRPDHEGLLLRHFAGHEHDDPPAGQAHRALNRLWPAYVKNCPAADLYRRLAMEDVQRAAGVTPDLSRLLSRIGLIT